jgi:glycosyltransferase involved in cell wall biosynthesis
MLRRGYPPEKVRLHYIGVDAARFCPDPAVVPQLRILFVGRLVEKKGCVDLLKAMVEVRAKYPEVELAVVGDGPLREKLESFAREHRLNVRFLGVHPPDVVLKLLRESLLFCLPSVRSGTGDSEGLGIVNLEAQAVGVPVVGTRHGGIPEAVEDGVTGLLAEERDPAGLARHILTLLSDAPLRAKMGQAARARIIRDFDLEKQSQLLEKQYLEFV